MDKYGYIGIETLLNFCENSKDHAVTPNDFMRMNRVRVPEQQWIPCSERPPEEDEPVFVYLFDDSPYIAWFCGGRWHTEEFILDEDEEPAAWMPLPESYRG